MPDLAAHRTALAAAALTGLLSQHTGGPGEPGTFHLDPEYAAGDVRAARNLARRAVQIADACLEILASTEPPSAPAR